MQGIPAANRNFTLRQSLLAAVAAREKAATSGSLERRLDEKIEALAGKLQLPHDRNRLAIALTGKGLGQLPGGEAALIEELADSLSSGSLPRPEIREAESVPAEADIEQTSAENALPASVQGAYAPSNNTILVREGLEGAELDATLNEEIGEWIAANGEKVGIDVAPGDKGARVAELFAPVSHYQSGNQLFGGHESRPSTTPLPTSTSPRADSYQADRSDSTRVKVDGQVVDAAARDEFGGAPPGFKPVPVDRNPSPQNGNKPIKNLLEIGFDGPGNFPLPNSQSPQNATSIENFERKVESRETQNEVNQLKNRQVSAELFHLKQRSPRLAASVQALREGRGNPSNNVAARLKNELQSDYNSLAGQFNNRLRPYTIAGTPENTALRNALITGTNGRTPAPPPAPGNADKRVNGQAVIQKISGHSVDFFFNPNIAQTIGKQLFSEPMQRIMRDRIYASNLSGALKQKFDQGVASGAIRPEFEVRLFIPTKDYISGRGNPGLANGFANIDFSKLQHTWAVRAGLTAAPGFQDVLTVFAEAGIEFSFDRQGGTLQQMNFVSEGEVGVVNNLFGGLKSVAGNIVQNANAAVDFLRNQFWGGIAPHNFIDQNRGRFLNVGAVNFLLDRITANTVGVARGASKLSWVKDGKGNFHFLPDIVTTEGLVIGGTSGSFSSPAIGGAGVVAESVNFVGRALHAGLSPEGNANLRARLRGNGPLERPE